MGAPPVGLERSPGTIADTIKRIAIIGAGPSGIAAAKYLLAEQVFSRIDIFEQRSTVGGVWNFSPEKCEGGTQIPRSDAHAPHERPRWKSNASHSEPVFLSAMYDDLETNIPNFQMQYSDFPFPEDSQLFPQREVVSKYLEDYAREVIPLVRFTTQVVEVRRSASPATAGTWTVKTVQLVSQQQTEDFYDAILVATGHYEVPFVPDIKGVEDWEKQHPHSIMHSKYYQNPDEYKDKTVLVVGNAASGFDIASHIARVCRQPLLVSQRSPSFLAVEPDARKDIRPEMAEVIPESKAVRFTDGSVRTGIDAIIFCTGYLYSFPFLESLEPRLILDGARTQHVYQHIFYIPQPSLAILTLPQRITPFVIAESQAAVVARVWARRLGLPSAAEMQSWENSVVAEKGTGKLFHVLGFPSEVEYINGLYDWSSQAEPRASGKAPPRWDKRMIWARERTFAIKAAFEAQGSRRHEVRSMEELGFNPEDVDDDNTTEATAAAEHAGQRAAPLDQSAAATWVDGGISMTTEEAHRRTSVATPTTVDVAGFDASQQSDSSSQSAAAEESCHKGGALGSHKRALVEWSTAGQPDEADAHQGPDQREDGSAKKIRLGDERDVEAEQRQAAESTNVVSDDSVRDGGAGAMCHETTSNQLARQMLQHAEQEKVHEEELGRMRVRVREHVEALRHVGKQHGSLVDEMRDVRVELEESRTGRERLERLLELGATEVAKAKERCTQLEVDLAEARKTAEGSSVPAIVDLARSQAEARASAAEMARLKGRLESTTRDFDFTRTQYQAASTAAGEARSEASVLRDENDTLRRKAGDEAGRVRAMSAAAAEERHLGRIRELELKLADREEHLRRKDEELRLQGRARGVGTRASSRSPQPYSRAISPNPAAPVRLAHPLRYGENL